MQQYKEQLNEQPTMFMVKASQNFIYHAVDFPDIKKKVSFFFFAEFIYFIDM